MLKVKKSNSLITATLTITLLVGVGLVAIETNSKGNNIFNEFQKITNESIKETYTFQNSKGKQGLMDGNGKIIIKAIYDEIYPFQGNFSIFKEKNQCGAIDKNGNTILNAEYYSLRQLSNEYILGIKNKNSTNFIYDENGELIFSIDNILNINYLGNELFTITNKEQETAIINKDTDFIIPYTANMMIGNASENLLIKTIVTPSTNGGFNKYDKQFIKYDGKPLLSESFEDIKFENNTILTFKNDKWGAINQNGDTLIENRFDNLEAFYNDTFIAKVSTNFGIVDKKGKFLIEPKYDDILVFHTELNKDFIVANLQGKFGVIDFNENIKIPFEYDNIQLISNGLIMLQKDNKFSFINKESEIIIPSFNCNSIFIQNNVARISVDDGTYFLNLNNKGELIGDIKFSNFYTPNFNLIEAIYNNELKYYINTETGKIIYKTKL